MSETTKLVVIGGSGGLGRATAAEIARRQTTTALLVYATNDDAARKAQAEVSAAGADVRLLKADVSTPSGIGALTEAITVELSSTVDVLVYAAAYRTLASSLTLSRDEWQRSFDVGVTGFVTTVQAVAPTMRRGGRIVALTGLSGVRAYSELHLAMGVAKAAVNHATRYLALELADRGITANAVCFGSVLTDGVADDLNPEQYQRFVADAASIIPKGRVPTPEEVIGPVVFLCSPESDWVVGQVLVVDGGQTLR